jgi:hypothetical protein
VRIPISYLLRNFLIGFIENDLMKNYNSKIAVFGEKYVLTGASCKSHLLRHSGESRNPEVLKNTGFRVALRLPGMTTSSCFQEFCKRLPVIREKIQGGL